MKKIIVAILAVLSFTTYASEKECIYKCSLTQKDVGFRIINMHPVGGYTKDMNTSCIYKNEDILIWVTSKSGYSTNIALSTQDQFISMEAPQNEGRFILKAFGYEIECFES